MTAERVYRSCMDAVRDIEHFIYEVTVLDT
jgi:hypothetical protein